MAEAAPLLPPKPARSVLIARADSETRTDPAPRGADLAGLARGRHGQELHRDGRPARRRNAFAGWVVRNPVAAGEPITEGKDHRAGRPRLPRRGAATRNARDLGAGDRHLRRFPASSSRATRSIWCSAIRCRRRPADRRRRKSDYEHKASQTVLRNVRVIGIDQRLDGKAGEAVVAHTATFEVTPKQGEIIALASEIGKVSLTLRSLVPARASPRTSDQAAELPLDSRPPPNSPIGRKRNLHARQRNQPAPAKTCRSGAGSGRGTADHRQAGRSGRRSCAEVKQRTETAVQPNLQQKGS